MRQKYPAASADRHARAIRQRWARCTAALAGAWALFAAQSALALPLPDDEAERRCWLKTTRERTRINLREPTAVEFSNLNDGDSVRSPVLVEFAVRGMGVAPAGLAVAGTGHHHVLVDRPLPPSVTDKIPFNDSHRHFGKGQTFALLDLAPGRHTLRLLFADHDHRPYFVFSREITIDVKGPRATTPAPRIDDAKTDASCEAWLQDTRSSPRPASEPLYVANVRAGEPLTSPFNLRLGALALGVCARGKCPEKTGHFMVDILDAGSRRAVQTHDLAKGTTQVNVFIPNGDYIVRLRMQDDAGNALLPPHELPVRVVAQQVL